VSHQGAAAGLSREQWTLMGGWQDIVDESRRLTRTLEALPDCPACLHATSAGCLSERPYEQGRPVCEPCRRLFEQLCDSVETLSDAAHRFMPVTTSVVVMALGAGLREPLAAVHSAIVAVERDLLGFRTHGRDSPQCTGAGIHGLTGGIEHLKVSVDAISREL
jgi:transcription elongation factor Elf1